MRPRPVTNGMNLNELTIQQASEGLRKKQFSVTELVSDCLDSIKEKDGKLHAYLEVFEDALEEAKKKDEVLQGLNAPGPLFGIPIAVKDNILIEGEKCTAGSRILDNYIASYDATAIQKLRRCGAIFIGKTNLDEFAMGSSTENSAFGPTKNPYDMSRVPGGSSGGSAAAVAAHTAMAALGSDTGGSVRQPASFCGVVGFKPTYGAVSRHGLISMASSLDQIGPLTKTVEDTRILFNAVAGKDNFDATSTDERKSDFPREVGLRNIRIGIPKEYFTSGLDPEIEKVIKSAIKRMEEAGSIMEEISLPSFEYTLPCYYIIVPSEISANLARYDGIRYGSAVTADKRGPKESRTNAENLYEVYAKTRAEKFGPEVKRRIMLGAYTLSAGYYDAYYLKAQKVRRLIREDFEKALERVEVILGPTTPTPAFKLGEKTDDPLKMYLADIYTVAVNLAGVPAISLPAGFTEIGGKKLPVGLQLIGKWFGEEKLLGVAEGVEKVLK